MESNKFDIYEVSVKWAIEQTEWQVENQSEISSTNDWAKEKLLNNDFKNGIFLTKHQIKGRGRFDHSWEDQGKGESLLSTWVFKLDSSPQHISAPLFGLALYQSAQRTWNSLPFSLKAPNDLLLNGNKLGGLLLEVVQSGSNIYLFIGLGVNVFSQPNNLESVTHLSGEDGVGNALSINEWLDFLNQLKSEFLIASQKCLNSEISQEDRSSLLKALNNNPRLVDKIWEISPNGDLIMENGPISWQSI